MGDWGGYALGGLTIVITIIINAVKSFNEKKRLIEVQTMEKAGLEFDCKDLRKIATEIKEVVRENYNVLARNLETLKLTMLQSDENICRRIDTVAEDVVDLQKKVSAHTAEIGHLKEDVHDIKLKAG